MENIYSIKAVVSKVNKILNCLILDRKPSKSLHFSTLFARFLNDAFPRHCITAICHEWWSIETQAHKHQLAVWYNDIVEKAPVALILWCNVSSMYSIKHTSSLVQCIVHTSVWTSMRKSFVVIIMYKLRFGCSHTCNLKIV